MKNDNQTVTSVWGKITRREMLKMMALSGFGLGGAGLSRAFAAPENTRTIMADDVLAPPKAIGGTPFRDIKNFQTFQDELTDFKNLSGMPKPRRRDTSWFDKPSNSIGVSLLQFTNTPKAPLNTCAQAACATLLNFHKKAPAGLTGDGITDEIYRTHPPNGGERGTSFLFTQKILDAYGMKTWAGMSNDLGEKVLTEKLKTWISQGFPCVVLVDVSVAMGEISGGMMGHFAVAFAYTDTHMFLTNWNYKKSGGWANDWATFMRAWSTPASKLHHGLLAGWV